MEGTALKPRKTLEEMGQDGRRKGVVCPKCGAAHMERIGGRALATGTIRRYRKCRNESCGATFVTSQPAENITREVVPDDDEDSPSGHKALTIHRATA